MLDRARYRGALLGSLIGDVFGAPFEGHRGVVPADDLAALFHDNGLLRYTDDTAMTIALAESLLRVGTIDGDDLARSFGTHWALAPERGYSSSTAGLLATFAGGAAGPNEAVAENDRSTRDTNGAAMRVSPTALFAAGEIGDAVDLARGSAQVTHTSPAAVSGACVQAAAISLALRAPANELLDLNAFAAALSAACDYAPMRDQLELAIELSDAGDATEIAERIGTGNLAMESVPTAICAFMSHPDSFTAAVSLAISVGGDTDSIAAMTGAICGARLGEQAIPSNWIARAESAARIRQLADLLFAEASRT
jgi:poly(ADP-ribose) glycohydrolase ARH3